MKQSSPNKAEWKQAGLLHREDEPVVIYSNGTFKYYINGKLLTKEEFDMYNFVKSL